MIQKKSGEEILINVAPHQTRVAIIENESLQELHIEKRNDAGVLANIYLGKVIRVLPGMQAAFIDIGLERSGFLHVTDIGDNYLSKSHIKKSLKKKISTGKINELIHQGQEILVQVMKEPMGEKGARLTTHLSIPSRYLVAVLSDRTVSISQKIDNIKDRELLSSRLKNSLENFSFESGFIIRTAAKFCPSLDFSRDLRFLENCLKSIEQNITTAKAGDLIYEDLPLYLQIIRDYRNNNLYKIQVDSLTIKNRIEEFLSILIPDFVEHLQLCNHDSDIFDLYSVEFEINQSLMRCVPLKSGGSIVIDQTEAMTTIDVNTGSFVGTADVEQTVYMTNIEAVASIIQQVRLRNIGGIIIVDFIDMTDNENRQHVLQALRVGLMNDNAKCNIVGMPELGLVQITRKRTQISLEDKLFESCPICKGRGKIKKVEAICDEIYRKIMRENRIYQTNGFLVITTQEVLDILTSEEKDNLHDLQEFIGKPIKIKLGERIYPNYYKVCPI